MTAYNLGDEEKTSRKAAIFAKAIKKDEWQLKNVVHMYAMARAMYYLLKISSRLSNRDHDAIVRLIYYCLLRNYSENCNTLYTDVKYADVIGGCELAFVFMCENGQFLIYQILSGVLGYLPNLAQKHVVDQMLLFGGIVKEANEKGFHHFLDTRISTHFNTLLKEVDKNIPIDTGLQIYKDGCAPIIATISKDLENGFSYESDEDELFL